jgi:hypothetical protein
VNAENFGLRVYVCESNIKEYGKLLETFSLFLNILMSWLRQKFSFLLIPIKPLLISCWKIFVFRNISTLSDGNGDGLCASSCKIIMYFDTKRSPLLLQHPVAVSTLPGRKTIF